MLLDRRLIFVTGKGGVGKTSIAAGLAALIAHSGRRTLLVEMDGKGSAADALSVPPFRYVPSPIPLAEVEHVGEDPAGRSGELAGMAMNTEDSLREYLRTVVRIPLVGRIGPLARTFDFVADAAPGVKEILAIGKVLSDIRIDAWDTIVVDAEATGHVLAQIAAPTALRELIKVGAVHEQTGWMLRLLQDPDTTTVAVVTTPEELAVNEALELIDRLPAEAGIQSSVVVANRVLPALFNRRQGDVLEHFARRPSPLVERFGVGVEPLVDAAVVAEHRRRHGTAQLARIAARSMPTISIGEFFGAGVDVADDQRDETPRDRATELIEHIASSIASELDVEPANRYLVRGAP